METYAQIRAALAEAEVAKRQSDIDAIDWLSEGISIQAEQLRSFISICYASGLIYYRIHIKLAVKALGGTPTPDARKTIAVRRARLSKRMTKFNRKFGSFLNDTEESESEDEDGDTAGVDAYGNELETVPEDTLIRLPSSLSAWTGRHTCAQLFVFENSSNERW